jgi:DNA-binding GntR family transcriptional regulator
MAKIEHQTLNDRAYAAIKKGLMSGQFKPGEVLTIRQLAHDYGISATPVREALQRLVAEHSLELLRNRSIAVPILTLDKFVELRRIRCLLEGLAAELATPHFRDSDLARLESTIVEIDRDINDKNAAGYLREANDGHRKIVTAIRSGKPEAVRDSVVWDISEAAESLMGRLREMEAEAALKSDPALQTTPRRSRPATARSPSGQGSTARR